MKVVVQYVGFGYRCANVGQYHQILIIVGWEGEGLSPNL